MSGRQNDQGQQPSGFKCPVCFGFIPVSVQQLLTSERFVCPHCAMEFRLNRSRSHKAIDALTKVKDAESGVERASVFRR
jgi:transcription elongation factor Elf1